jgi:stage II sporulation protein D
MDRHAFYHVVTVAAGLFLVFAGHACGTGRPVREDLRVGDVNPPPVVQVGLGRCLRESAVRVAVRGPWQLRGRSEVLAKGGGLGWTDVRAEDGLRFGKELHAETLLTLVPEEDGTLEVEYLRDHRGNPVRATGVRYPGTLLIHALPDRKLALVNEVDLEDYLRGVVGKEMHLSEGVEALKTQVIAARTYAIHEQRLGRLRRVKGEKFDLYDDERSQVYGGMERATGFAGRLVDDTRGMFLMHEGRIVRAFYASSCGGHTEPAWEVLGDETERTPPLGGTKCGFCERRPGTRWKEPVLVPKREIAEKCLSKDYPAARIRTVEISKRLPGGHAIEVSVFLEGYSKPVKLHANNDFRRALGPSKFRSTMWERLEDRGDSIAVFGLGYGHGAGMCQVGAYEMARDGRTAQEILEYYFPGARVQKVY